MGELVTNPNPQRLTSRLLHNPQRTADNVITFSGSESGAKSIKNVLFGDVFLCSGQSNMEFSVNGAFNATAEIADSANYPGLRLATVQKVPSNTPLANTTSKAPYAWAVSGPAAMQPVGGAGFSYFSATCYFAGRDIYKGLGSTIPIGLVASDWGGQTVETFSSPDALADATCGGTVTAEEGETLAYHDDKRRRLPGASQLWNGMIYPIVHMRFAAAFWYQGEANAGNPPSYACRTF